MTDEETRAKLLKWKNIPTPAPAKRGHIKPGRVKLRDFLQVAVDNLEPDDPDYDRFRTMHEAVEEYLAERAELFRTGASAQTDNAAIVKAHYQPGDSVNRLLRRIRTKTGAQISRATVARHMQKLRPE